MNTLMRLPSLFGWADELEPVFRTELQGHTPRLRSRKVTKNIALLPICQA